MNAPVREKILKFVKEKKTVTGTSLREHFGVSRQAINIHIQKLVSMGKVLRVGSKSGTVYIYAGSNEIEEVAKGKKYYQSVENINPDEIFNYYKKILKFERTLNKNAYEIVQYTFKSILNSALSHSGTKKLFIYTGMYKNDITVAIRDYGIGIFRSIQKEINTRSEYRALGAFLKGEIPDMEKRGLTILCKLGDWVQIKSHRINVIFDNVNNKIVIENIMRKKGTYIKFTIDRNTQKRLNKYINGVRWGKPNIIVKIFREGKKDVLSQFKLRAFLNGFDKIEKLTFDFNGKKKMPEKTKDVLSKFLTKKHRYKHINLANIPESLKTQLFTEYK